ncbi:MAG: DUF952 domain-containing protein [Rhodospirillaceae bacterium]|jgi:uncharacterized protein (DUF952 family)|nr:DUF952 domain-containing protein [Rhodospirillaceae bacterium]
MTTNWLYHIAERGVWDTQSEATTYVPDAYADEGFVHLSYAEQLQGTAHRYYTGRDDLVVLRLSPEHLGGDVVAENLLGGETLFPHFYSPIPKTSVDALGNVQWNANGPNTIAVHWIPFILLPKAGAT